MRNAVLAAAISAGAFACALSSADAGTLIPVPQVPGSSATFVTGINDGNIIAGYYTTPATPDDRRHGFFGTLNGQYTTFDYAPEGDTVPQAIGNDGRITGWWRKNSNAVTNVQFIRNGDGTVQRITLNGRRLRGSGKPGALLSTGEFVGEYEAERKTTGYFKRPKGYAGTGTDYISEIVLPFRKVYGTYPAGLNAMGDIAGSFSPCDVCSFVGFLMKHGTVHKIVFPDFSENGTSLAAINDAGVAVGSYNQYANGENGPVAFLYNSATDSFKQLPGAHALAINNSGVIALNADGGPYLYCT